MNKLRHHLVILTLGLWLLALPQTGSAAETRQAPAPSGSRYFPETGHTVTGRFLEYWEQHGGLAQQGFPLSEELQETSDTDGKLYMVQYFERAVFEHHPELAPPYDVLLSLLGVFEYRLRHAGGAIPAQHASTDQPRFFPQTGHTIGGKFRAYWEQHGGLAQQGYPISDEFLETSLLDGKTYTVQYFQRAVFESHPENSGTPSEVLLSQLGTFRYRTKHSPPLLNIPVPAASRRQVGARGSDSYLVWVEVSSTPNDPSLPDSAHLMGLDLHANRAFTVTAVSRNPSSPAIAGPLVVWDDNAASCPTCERDVVGQDLATSSQFAVATGPSDQVAPAISGKTVVWLERDGPTRRLLAKDLATDQTTTIRASVGTTTTLWAPLISDDYLVWSETTPGTSPGFYPARLYAYERTTGALQTVAEYGVNNGSQPDYALDTHRVIWTDGGTLKFADVSTGERANLAQGAITAPAIQGDTVVWNDRRGPTTECGTHVWGLTLAARRPRLLVSREGCQDRPIVAGAWLVWENRGGPDDGRLGATPLAAAFAAAPPP